MLVYGDASRFERTHDKLERIRQRLLQPDCDALRDALVEAGELAQGIADAEFEALGCDSRSPAQDAAMRLLVAIARAMLGSGAPELHQLERATLPERIRTRRAEGFAFYAVYPECYAEAARALRGRPVRVIGLRSIGTALCAVVAAALDAPLPVTLRPTGHPFQRTLALSTALERELVSEPNCDFAIVDEGPGISGSSFGTVADFLEDRGVARERIHFFPSHAGALGPIASERHRRRWASAEKHLASFDEIIAPQLAEAVEPLLGAPQAPMQELSGGAWRTLRCSREREWPASHLQQERRKFLLRTSTGSWLLKFAGLGDAGEEALTRARALEDAGFSPEVVGLRNGFLVQRWLDGATSLEANRPDLLDSVTRYLAFRANAFPAEPDAGASLAQLLEMARHNIREGLEAGAEDALEPFRESLAQIEHSQHRVQTDNRMHAWEWLEHEGRLLKCDAVDHCAAHDLIGCQDIAWDIAGAEFELGVDGDALAQRVARSTGRDANPRLLALMRPCYLAFQLGCWTMAAESNADSDERVRLRARAEHYRELLRKELASLNRRRASRTRRRP